MSKRTDGENNDALSPDFLDFIPCLNEHRVYRRTKATVRRLCAAMEDFGAPPEVIDQDALMTPEIATQFGQPPYRIDLLNAIDGVSFAKVWSGATTVTIQGQTIRVIGLADLQTNKTATGRPKDAEDVRRLLRRTPRKRR